MYKTTSRINYCYKTTYQINSSQSNKFWLSNLLTYLLCNLRLILRKSLGTNMGQCLFTSTDRILLTDWLAGWLTFIEIARHRKSYAAAMVADEKEENSVWPDWAIFKSSWQQICKHKYCQKDCWQLAYCEKDQLMQQLLRWIFLGNLLWKQLGNFFTPNIWSHWRRSKKSCRVCASLADRRRRCRRRNRV